MLTRNQENKAITGRTTNLRTENLANIFEVCSDGKEQHATSYYLFQLSASDEEALLQVLKKHSKTIGWTLVDI